MDLTQNGRYLAPMARILLTIAYLRDHKDADARALLVQLEHSLIADPWRRNREL